MCLHKTHILPKIAWKPIKCYKLVESTLDSNFRTPYLHYTGTFNKPIRHKVLRLGIFERDLRGEVVHALREKLNNPTRYLRVIECIIPRFTLYWLGDCDDIGARTIVPLRFIE